MAKRRKRILGPKETHRLHSPEKSAPREDPLLLCLPPWGP